MSGGPPFICGRDEHFPDYKATRNPTPPDLLAQVPRILEVARLLGFPGKLGMDGSQVWEAYQRGELGKIRSYCETDVVNTFLVYLRFQLMRGVLTSDQYEHELDLVHDTLVRSPASHWQEFIGAWQRPARSDTAPH